MIKETIVVEGRDDITAVKAAVDAHVIATGGSHFGQKKLDEIKKAQECTGIIVLTDPDYAGIRIREKIRKAVPGALHAYLPRQEGIRDRQIGVEYATPEAIRAALANLHTEREAVSQFTSRDLYRLGLTGSNESAGRRTKVCNALHIGDCNARQFLIRLNRYGISKERLLEILEDTDGE